MILPMKMMILKSMAQSNDDSPAVRDVKGAIRNEPEQRYKDPAIQDYRHNSTTLDPPFESLLHLDAATRQRVYEALTTEIVVSIEQVGIIYEFRSFYFTSVRILNQIILSNVNKYIYIFKKNI